MELKPASTPKKERSEAAIKLEQSMRDLLEPGETLLGVTAASHQKSMFSGGVVNLAVTDRRLIIQPLDRRGRNVKGDAVSITQPEIDKASIGRSGGTDPSGILVSQVAIQVKIKTTGGEKYKFSMMDGQGNGLLGKLSGGESQLSTVQALRAFLGDTDAAAEI
ncbi:MAG: hypothetical protein IPK93_11745 [Solirubrobacterales bacterium]|nr:hypothetical protein [Solirubrobacterales bacterium]